MYETPLQLGDPFPPKKAMPNFRERVSRWNQLLQLRENMKIIIHICDSVLLSPYTLNSLILGGSTEHSQNTRLSSSSAFYEVVLPLASISFPPAYALRMNCV